MFKKIKFIIIAIYHRIISKNKLAKIQGVKFGKNCKFMTRSWGAEPYLITMGNDVSTSSGVKFITHDGSARVIRKIYKEDKDIDLIEKITIGNNVFIGMDTLLLPGSIVGDNVIIGAMSLVRGQLKSDSVYAGVPIKYICSIEEYKTKNQNRFIQTKNISPKEKKEFLLKKYNLSKRETTCVE